MRISDWSSDVCSADLGARPRDGAGGHPPARKERRPFGRLARGMSDLLPVAEAQARILALRTPLSPETIAFSECFGRYLSQPVTALPDQPAAARSALAGSADPLPHLPAPWTLSGALP